MFLSIECAFRLQKVKLSIDRILRRKLTAPRPALRMSKQSSVGKSLLDAISRAEVDRETTDIRASL